MQPDRKRADPPRQEAEGAFADKTRDAEGIQGQEEVIEAGEDEEVTELPERDAMSIVDPDVLYGLAPGVLSRPPIGTLRDSV
jgi:hypothetical protein